jgi:ATPase family associated with various cellular activities (AAA)
VAKTSQLTKLFRALAEQDVPQAEAEAAQIAAMEERKGHFRAAKELRGSLGRNGVKTVGTDFTMARTAPVLAALALQDTQGLSLDRVELPAGVRHEVSAVIAEVRHVDELRSAGVERRSRLLFYGPPGCGKSFTARALSAETGLPAYLVRFDAIIGAYLGETAQNLRDLFRFALTTPSVIVLDEVDALGVQRGNRRDVGELDRIVIALMQELEHTVIPGFIVGTTNLEKHLDLALWRRFDLSLEFPKPSSADATKFASKLARQFGVRLTPLLKAGAARATSFSEVEWLIHSEVRRRVIEMALDNARRNTR